MVKTILILLSTALIATIWATTTYAQTNSYDLKKTSDQYKATGTVSLTRSGNRMNYSIVAKDLPSPLPGGGVYYLAWALTSEGKADNLGTITNNSELKGTLNVKATQIFITSEKERYPEFVQGPRIIQTDSIPTSVFDNIASPTPTASGTPVQTATGSAVPVGGPTGAPETGLGGAALLNGMIISLGGIGVTGLFFSLRKKFRKA